MKNLLFFSSLLFGLISSLNAQTTSGEASYYAPNMNGKNTATGEVYKHQDFTCANSEFPVGTILRVTRVDDSRSVDVRVNDCNKSDRIVILSGAAAAKIGLISDGITRVNLSIVKKGTGDLACGNSSPDSYEVVSTRIGSEEPSLSIKGEGTFSASALQPIRAGYGVQIGSYTDYANASEAASNLQAKGFGKVLIRLKNDTHQVVLGPFETSAAAEVYRRNLKENYQIGGFVTPIVAE